jgi:Mg2+-importing ATPase
LTELLVALIVRTRRPFFKSRPGTLLVALTLVLVPVTLAIPYLPALRTIMGFVPLRRSVAAAVVAITVGYLAATEALKARFYRLAQD